MLPEKKMKKEKKMENTTIQKNLSNSVLKIEKKAGSKKKKRIELKYTLLYCDCIK